MINLYLDVCTPDIDNRLIYRSKIPNYSTTFSYDLIGVTKAELLLLFKAAFVNGMEFQAKGLKQSDACFEEYMKEVMTND
jgi:hypothetical protein